MAPGRSTAQQQQSCHLAGHDRYTAPVDAPALKASSPYVAVLLQANISKAREVYRPVAMRGGLLYFFIDSLNALDRVYHYSMAAFVQILKKGALSISCQAFHFVNYAV